TGGLADRGKAEQTVNETLRRAKNSLGLRSRRDILWVGPIQGGKYLDLVEYSACETAKLPFDIYALGSPTQILERYQFDCLVNMILAAKKNLPVDKPFHLFGAGHPLMMAFAVALGCDIFDSAAYAIYAREGKYMTVQGTQRLEQLRYFPCSCEVCSSYTQKEAIALPRGQKTTFLARHNLSVCFEEIKNIKQAIYEGRLWELLELRARCHPSLLRAFKALSEHTYLLEEYSPITHTRGLLFYDSLSLSRPEVTRHRLRIKSWSPVRGRVLLFLPEPSSKPFHRSREMRRILGIFNEKLLENIGVCVYSAPFGVTPLELDEVYPLSQFEVARPFDYETKAYVAGQVAEYVNSKWQFYEGVVVYAAGELGEEVAYMVERMCRSSCVTIVRVTEHPWGGANLRMLADTVANVAHAPKDTF
ncbi:MAG: tRNA guanosine(15) transglycosylase TgtA, partial [Candidatus Bathyarchaeia archaeon]